MKHDKNAKAVLGEFADILLLLELLSSVNKSFVFILHPLAHQRPQAGQEEIKLISSVPRGNELAEAANL